jgi:EAL domain-containing protein (putative c-di-GMP-specific phosphodiesterase class I)
VARLFLQLPPALDRNEFVLHYQPKACLKTGEVTGVEALMRWHSPGQGMVPPDRFIRVLEDSGLILPVGAWAIRTACAEIAAWDRAGLPPLTLAVNLSARQFRQPFLARFIEDTLAETGVPPRRLELELTESLLMEDSEATRSVLATLARMGVRVAMDDFGTGHSSLSYLKRFDIDTLKIDRSFVSELPRDPEDTAISRAITAMGHSLHMKVVAEGVETAEQAECLRELGCDEMQGYLLSRPLPPDAFVDWLLQRMAEQVQRDTGGHRWDDSAPLTLMTMETLG